MTGAGGFLGSHLCRYFAARGFQVAAVGRFNTTSEPSPPLANLPLLGGMTLPDPAFARLVSSFQPHLLVHCAGTSSVADSVREPYMDFQRTVEVCAFTLECVRQHVPGCHFVHLSSASVYGQPSRLPIDEEAPCAPLSPYGYHKRMCETLVEEYSGLFGITASILRIFSAYGENLRKQVVFDLCRKLLDESGPTIEVEGTGQESRDFVHAVDVAQAIDRIHAVGASGVFNVGSGTETSITSLLAILQQELQSTKAAKFSNLNGKGNPLNWRADIGKLAKLGFSPTVPLHQGLGTYCRWFREVVHNTAAAEWTRGPRAATFG